MKLKPAPWQDPWRGPVRASQPEWDMIPDHFYRKLLDNLSDGVYYVDRHRTITYWNKAAERISGFSAEEVVGKHCADNILRHVDEKGKELCRQGCPLAAVIKSGVPREAEVFMHHKDGYRVPISVRGAPIHDEAGKIIGAVEVFFNNAKNIHAQATIEMLQHVAYRDALTDLGNRRFASLNLDNLLEGAKQQEVPFGVLFVDVDHFKSVNDTWGHDVGDKVLRMAAMTMANGLRPLDVPCRWGGEEFLILLPNVDMQTTVTVAERLRVMIENSWLEEGDAIIRVTATFGATVYLPGDTAKSILARADMLAYHGKEHGRNCVCLQQARGCEVYQPS